MRIESILFFPVASLMLAGMMTGCAAAKPATNSSAPSAVQPPTDTFFSGTMTVTSPDGQTPYGPPENSIVQRTLRPAEGVIVESVMQDKLIVTTWTLEGGRKDVFDVKDADGTFSGTVTVSGDPWSFSSWTYDISMADGSGQLAGHGTWDTGGIHTKKTFTSDAGRGAQITDELHPASADEEAKIRAALASRSVSTVTSR